jgi:hypothetical protein
MSYQSTDGISSSTILQLGWWQHSAPHFHHVVRYGQPKLLHIRVVVEVSSAHQVVDFSLPVWRRSGGSLDHGRCLHVSQLLDAPLAGNYVAHLQWQVSVLVLLSYLQARQVRVSQLHLVLVQEVLGHRALDRLAVLQLQWEAERSGCVSIKGSALGLKFLRLHLCRASGDIANTVFPPHGTTVGDLNLQTLDFLGEFDSLGVCQRFSLFIDIPDIQHLTHELNHRLRFVESRGRNCETNHLDPRLI